VTWCWWVCLWHPKNTWQTGSRVCVILALWRPRLLFAFLKTTGPIIDDHHCRSQMPSMEPACVSQVTGSRAASIRVHSPAQSVHCIPNRTRDSAIWHSRCQGGHGKQDQTARVQPRFPVAVDSKYISSWSKVCVAVRRAQESVSFSVFSSDCHPVLSHPPRGSLVSTHPPRGISGQADIGSSSEPSERALIIHPFVQCPRSLHDFSLSSALPLPSFCAGVRLP